MASYTEAIRTQLASGPARARQLAESIRISQPTVSRALDAMRDELVRIGAGPSIQYALRDRTRGLEPQPIYRVDAAGRLCALGTLVPVRPEGFVMMQADGTTLHSDGLPWWLFDMRPQGYLGRAYAARHAASIGLPGQLNQWTDSHVLLALQAHGHDVVGNLLLGDVSRARFLSAAGPAPVPLQHRGEHYARMADEAARGEAPGSSAGGEQPKFAAYVEAASGAQHVLVKFTDNSDNPVSGRWRDLLLAEHLALQTLRAAGIPAAETALIDHGVQRFLQVSRFDRIGEYGRRGVVSLSALNAEFVGAGTSLWHAITPQLVHAGVITPQASDGAALLYAYGTLIGNTDMHAGNVAFLNEDGRPYPLAPAYDMLPMTFAPRSGGGLNNTVPAATLHAGISNALWRQALTLAEAFLLRLHLLGLQQTAQNRPPDTVGFSADFLPCIAALEQHIHATKVQIQRLA
ncbi:type II toxin-antitoxin system HipA family toxin YjjJ [Methylobacillus flagellatus]|uniref:type II toxin-antitoxin system HipA family toxin YjjJ n=1 Tax=Methylobacillus flagellatus TaxID=405 RepID=UPI0010F8C681|nr:type II toxin-antitoxin system HipA family toxin YjjJ [Methylobacillus flagellatus]